jgi:hypothetical protein
MKAITEPDMLVVEFAGYGLMRIPTDPDPTDETRGVSGYTFAFGNEPDLDRAIYLQPPANYIRSHSPDPIGVFVKSASRRFAQPGKPDQDLPALVGAKMNWEGSPKLENRNLILTVAGMEPISPFNMRIKNDNIDIYRTVPINPGDRHQPVYKASSGDLARMAAVGMLPEPDTIRRATGMSDPYKRLLERIALLEKDKTALEAQPPSQANEDLLVVIEGRLAQLRIGRDEPSNRRVANSVMVERFGFGMDGGDCVIGGDQGKVLGGTLDPAVVGPKGPDGNPTPSGWQIAFWIGGWDADLLCAYFQGTLMAPYAT